MGLVRCESQVDSPRVGDSEVVRDWGNGVRISETGRGWGSGHWGPQGEESELGWKLLGGVSKTGNPQLVVGSRIKAKGRRSGAMLG